MKLIDRLRSVNPVLASMLAMPAALLTTFVVIGLPAILAIRVVMSLHMDNVLTPVLVLAVLFAAFSLGIRLYVKVQNRFDPQ